MPRRERRHPDGDASDTLTNVLDEGSVESLRALDALTS